MQTDQLRQKLKELAFTAGLPDHVIEQISAVSLVIDYPAGTVIFREGHVSHTLHIVSSGCVALDMCVPARGCLRLLSLGPGDMVAWSALLGRGEMTATAVAVEDTQTIAISAPKLLEICELNHNVGYQIMQRMARALSQRLVATRLQLMDLFSTESPTIKS
jgi:CRP/FNR family cyclic AMP-dependent transcriptional regulator